VVGAARTYFQKAVRLVAGSVRPAARHARRLGCSPLLIPNLLPHIESHMSVKRALSLYPRAPTQARVELQK
jgi:hypothetical protein